MNKSREISATINSCRLVNAYAEINQMRELIIIKYSQGTILRFASFSICRVSRDNNTERPVLDPCYPSARVSPRE